MVTVQVINAEKVYKMSVQQERSEVEADQDIEQKEQPAVEVEPEPVVLNDDMVSAVAEEVAHEANISDFTAPRSNINHGHDTDKHDVRDAFGVRDEFVSEHFSDYGIAPNDHAALWLMSYKKDEFISADEKVFSDTQDTNQDRWGRIESAKTSAPIAPETQKALQQ